MKPVLSCGLVLLLTASFTHGTPAASGYVGPGDVIPTFGSSTFDGFAGLRAFSQAQLPTGACPGSTGCTKAIRICDLATGLICKDEYILPSGYLDTAGLKDAPGQPCYPDSTAASRTCVVATLYDQQSIPHDANRDYIPNVGAGLYPPYFVFDGPNGYPAMYNNGAFGKGLASIGSNWKDTGIPYINSFLVYSTGGSTIDSQGGENVSIAGGNQFQILYGHPPDSIYMPGATSNIWLSGTLLMAGGGQGASGQNLNPTGDYITVIFTGGGSPNINGTNTYNVGDKIGFAGTNDTLPPGINRTQGYYICTNTGSMFTINTSAATCASPGPITFSSSGSGTHNAAPALSYFMVNGLFKDPCNPCWGGYVFGYAPKYIINGDGGYLNGYALEYSIISSRGTTLTTSVMLTLNTNQCQAYGGLC